jgi:hypothetical protein
MEPSLIGRGLFLFNLKFRRALVFPSFLSSWLHLREKYSGPFLPASEGFCPYTERQQHRDLREIRQGQIFFLLPGPDFLHHPVEVAQGLPAVSEEGRTVPGS